MDLLKVLCFLILILIVGCTPYEFEPPPPSPYPLQIEITPSMRTIYQELLYNCASYNSEFVLILDTTPYSQLDLENTDMIIQLGEPEDGLTNFTYQFRQEEIILITSPDINPAILSPEQIKEQYTAMKPDFSIWTYPEGHEMERLFSHLILDGVALSPYSQLVPNPEAMLETINGGYNSIGYILNSFTNEFTNQISVDQSIQDSLTQPVLLISKREPVGDVREFIACLQETD